METNDNNKKKTYLLIGIVLILIIIGILLAYFLLGKKTVTLPTTPETPSFPTSNNGQTSNTNQPKGPGGQTPGSSTNPALKDALVQLTSAPVSGYGLSLKDGIYAVRYADSATGNIFEIQPDGSAMTRLSNTTIPKSEEAYFSQNGDTVVLRRVADDAETIESFDAAITANSGNSGEGGLKGSFLAQNITAMSVSPQSDAVFYVRTLEGGAEGVLMSPNTSQKKQIFLSPLREWLTTWPNEDVITLTTKPSAKAPGFLYFLNPKTGVLRKMFGGQSGFTNIVSPKADKILYANGADRMFNFNIFSLTTRETTYLTVRTMPEKCVWSGEPDTLYCGVPQLMPTGDYPDGWYQGKFSFSDDIWRVNTKDGIADLIMTLGTSNDGIDFINPELSDNNQYLLFTDKKTGFLWALDLVLLKKNQESQ